MSLEATPKYQYRAKDGLYYESYSDMREANIRVNDEVLRDKGLDVSILHHALKKKRKKSRETTGRVGPNDEEEGYNEDDDRNESDDEDVLMTPSHSSRKKRKEPLRRSKRTKGEKPEHGSLPGDSSVWIESLASSTTNGTTTPITPTTPSTINGSTTASKSRRKVKKTQKWITLNETQKETVRSMLKTTTLSSLSKRAPHSTRVVIDDDDDIDWKDLLQRYLIDEEELSSQNTNGVMRQVYKLSEGEGVTYKHWPDGVYFYKNIRVDMTYDFTKLYNEAVSFEDKYGRDLGNGWLLRHPISKLGNFQNFLLENNKKKDVKEPRKKGKVKKLVAVVSPTTLIEEISTVS